MRKRTVFEVDRQLSVSAARCAKYRAKGDVRSEATERHVQNRLLDERNVLARQERAR